MAEKSRHPGSGQTAHDGHAGPALPQFAEAAAAAAGPPPVKRAAGQVVDHLVTAIALGGYEPGHKLPPERELAQRLEVSRTTLRDAMHQLAAMGYISIRRGRNGGATVAAAWDPASSEHTRRVLLPRWQHFEWLFDLGEVFTPLVAQLAAERRQAADVDRIRAAVAEYRQAAGDRDALRVADHAVHTAISQAAQNPYLVSLEFQIRAQLSLGTLALPYSEPIRRQAQVDHQAMATAIADGDAEAAARLARHHFATLAEAPLRRLREQVRGAAPPPEPTTAESTSTAPTAFSDGNDAGVGGPP